MTGHDIKTMFLFLMTYTTTQVEAYLLPGCPLAKQ